MAAIERSISALIALLVLVWPLQADRAADVRSEISYIATALSSGNPADAMTPFDKSFANYDKLGSYFQGLTAFQVENEIDITDEQDTETDTKLTVNWSLTLTDLGNDSTEQRSGDINVRLVLRDGKWKIVDFSPISLFNPQQNRAPKHQNR